MAIQLQALLDQMIRLGGTNLHIKAQSPVYVRNLERLERLDLPAPSAADLDELVDRTLEADRRALFEEGHQVDTIVSLGQPPSRFRFLAFRQRSSTGVVVRHLPDRPMPLGEIGLPKVARELLSRRRGMILVSGPASSGKTTTVAAILDRWSRDLDAHIVTLENPVEYLLTSEKALVTQRQIGSDTGTYATGLRHVLRQDPDIIFVGELDTVETASIALAAAETGHLVITTLHAPTTATAIEQVIRMFPPQSQEQIRLRLSLSLVGVISQILIPAADRSKRLAVFEVLTPSEGIRNLIRLDQSYRIADTMEMTPNCCSFTEGVARLIQRGQVSRGHAVKYLGEKGKTAVV